ncbi:MAG: S8 family serine peptidase [Anaerolineae bacterium]|nr:S8 family serine peptidase [Anaerolineae bacterium]
MYKKFITLAVIALAIMVVVAPSLGIAAPHSLGEPAPIKLKVGTFEPTRGEDPPIPAGLATPGYANDQRGYYLIQFSGPVQQDWKNQVSALGVDFLGYVPDFAFKVRMNPAQAKRVEKLGTVAWVGLFHPAYKLSPDLKMDGTQLFTVRLEQGTNFGLTVAAVQSTGALVSVKDSNILQIAADSAQLTAVAHVLDVAWIENFALNQRHNEYGAGVIIGANIANANGFDGSTQIVAVADTGLGGGTASTAHADIPTGRITSITSLTSTTDQCFKTIIPDGAIDVDSGHGTHTAISVLGDGGPAGEGKGSAPAANLVFQATEDYVITTNYCKLFGYGDGYYLSGLPANLLNLFQPTYNIGARIHSNSWGSDAAGAYTANSVSTDSFIWNNPDMTITFSAGNAGTDANADGYVDEDSMGAPATAKNVITVGASENDRSGDFSCDTGLSYTNCSGQGGQNNIFAYGAAWPSDYPANPIASDPSAGNPQQLAAFSSRGPTDDGRIKPDVVAPGTWVLSGYSDLYQQAYDGSPNPQNGLYQYDGWGFPLNAQYKYMGGTSMSNPIVAGGAAIIRDFYQKVFTHNASAALVKATLINSAVDLLDENNDGVNDNAFPIPNNHEGWGLVNLANATDGSHLYYDVTPGLATSGSASYPFTVTTAGTLFKVTLVWSDYPSTEGASTNLVNDLDLVITSPSGATYRGNVFSGGWSQTGGNIDRLNNVENVFIQSAEAGTWNVQVSGFNIPNGPQPYALVVDGTFGTPPTSTPTSPPTATATTGPSPTPTATPLPTNTPTATATSAPTNTPSTQVLNVAVSTDKPTYVNKETVVITVLVTDGGGAPVQGAAVSVTLTVASGGQLGANGTTNASGIATFTYKVNKGRDGAGTYRIDATATKAGYQNGSGFVTFEVQ